jgi:RNA polymerase sigma-70 factor (ECF subfamily)
MAIGKPDMDPILEPADPPDSRSDLELIAAMEEGETPAFDVLYYRYRDWVVSLAYRFTCDRELALDVLQETFLYLLKKFPGFQLRAHLKTFLYPAVKHLSLAARNQSRRFQSSEADLREMEESMTTNPVIAEHEPLRAALAILSAEHREVLLLRFVDGLSLGEIADAMEIPLGTVKSRLHNALATLREDERTRGFFL